MPLITELRIRVPLDDPIIDGYYKGQGIVINDHTRDNDDEHRLQLVALTICLEQF